MQAGKDRRHRLQRVTEAMQESKGRRVLQAWQHQAQRRVSSRRQDAAAALHLWRYCCCKAVRAWKVFMNA